MALPRLPEDVTDDENEELSDEQIHELLDEAERSLRAKQAQHETAHAPFKLPQLGTGNMTEKYLKTKGSVTRADPSKLVNKGQKALAEGIKKIEDPVQVKKQKLEVCKPCSLTWIKCYKQHKLRPCAIAVA